MLYSHVALIVLYAYISELKQCAATLLWLHHSVEIHGTAYHHLRQFIFSSVPSVDGGNHLSGAHHCYPVAEVDGLTHLMCNKYNGIAFAGHSPQGIEKFVHFLCGEHGSRLIEYYYA